LENPCSFQNKLPYAICINADNNWWTRCHTNMMQVTLESYK
jgi:hypothetical protein